MKKFFKAIGKWFKSSDVGDWLIKVFKNQLGKIIGEIYKDAINTVQETKELCDWIVTSEEDFEAIQNIVKDQYGIELSTGQIGKIQNDNYRERFNIAKELLIKKLEESGKEYKEYIVDTVIQLAYSYLKERSE